MWWSSRTCELILSVSASGYGLIGNAIRTIRPRNEAQQVGCDRILAGGGNDGRRENLRPWDVRSILIV